MINFYTLIEEAKKPGSIYCPECKDNYYSIMDKLSILLYNKCSLHFKEGSYEEDSIIKLAGMI